MSDVLIAGSFTVLGGLIAAGTNLAVSYSTSRKEMQRFEKKMEAQEKVENRQRRADAYLPFCRAFLDLSGEPSSLMKFRRDLDPYWDRVLLYSSRDVWNDIKKFILRVEDKESSKNENFKAIVHEAGQLVQKMRAEMDSES